MSHLHCPFLLFYSLHSCPVKPEKPANAVKLAYHAGTTGCNRKMGVVISRGESYYIIVGY
jgi:hypothetical protein